MPFLCVPRLQYSVQFCAWLALGHFPDLATDYFDAAVYDQDATEHPSGLFWLQRHSQPENNRLKVCSRVAYQRNHV